MRSATGDAFLNDDDQPVRQARDAKDLVGCGLFAE
jgi:hypothetical protein